MKKDDILIYYGDNNKYFTKYKKYIIKKIQNCINNDNSIVQYFCVVNDLGDDGLYFTNGVEGRNFINVRQQRKEKIKKLNEKY